MHDLVIADIGTGPLWWMLSTDATEFMALRKALGLERYHTILQAGNGRNPFQDCTEELADAVVYARQMLEECTDDNRWHGLREFYKHVLALYVESRKLALQRGDKDARVV
jgi:hypothetical protein